MEKSRPWCGTAQRRRVPGLIDKRDWYSGQDTSELNFRVESSGLSCGRLMTLTTGDITSRLRLKLDSPPEQIIAPMDYASIDRVPIQAGTTHSRPNEYPVGLDWHLSAQWYISRFRGTRNDGALVAPSLCDLYSDQYPRR
jgi:hypothetical protein